MKLYKQHSNKNCMNLLHIYKSKSVNKFRIIFTLILLLTIINTSGYSQIIISEFLASNVSVNPEMEDFDDYSDWIELYNNSSQSVSLDGYFLTDNLDKPTKWKIPAGITIEPHGYFLFWADGYDDVPDNRYTRPNWPWDSFITQNYHTSFKLAAEGEELGLYRADGINTWELITAESEWKFLDDGSDQGSLWIQDGFDDSDWNVGQAQFGYGGNGEVTTISYGSDSQNKYITTYFRKRFNISDVNILQSLTLDLVRDDGAIVYLNGQEVLRSNMPDGTINHDVLSSSSVSGDDETRFFSSEISPDFLMEGENIIAVEIHQSSKTSSDLSFDLKLSGISISSGLEVVDAITFPYQFPDISYGKNLSDDKFYFYNEPTPGTANNTSFITGTDQSSSVDFSISGGFYNASQVLQLSSSSGNGEIFYTLDGSKPSSSSLKYSSPISIDNSTIIRARVYETNKFPGEIVSSTYFINDNETTLPVISLIADPATLWDDKIGIYENEYKDREVPVSLEYYETNKNLGFAVNAGAKIGGMNIFRFAQKPFNIFLRGKYGDDLINYQIFENKPIGTFQRIALRNGGDDWEDCMIRDAMAEAITSGQMTCGIMGYNPTEFYLNGEFWGIYNIRERFQEYYFASNYNVDPADVDHLGYSYTTGYDNLELVVQSGSSDEYLSLLNYITTNDMAQPEFYEYVKSQIDLDSFMDFCIIEFYVSNSSWKHNREWWKSKSGDNKWHWVTPDLDRGFYGDRINSNLIDNFLSEYPLFQNLTQNSEFRNRFVQRFAAHLNSTFQPDRICAIVDSLSEKIAPAMVRQVQRWGQNGGISSISIWEDNLEVIRKFARERIPYVLEDIEQEFNLDGSSQLSINLNLPKSGDIVVEGVPLLEDQLTGTYFNNSPLHIKAVPKVGYKFVNWEGLSNSNTIEVSLTGDMNLVANFEAVAVHTIPENITSTVVLSSDNSEYYATQDVVVHENASLIIENGINVKMAKNVNIIVNGQLIINGTEDKPVEILPDYEKDINHWGALCFVNTSDTSRISHVRISGATKGYDPINLKAAISGKNANLIIDSAFLEKNEFPIFIQNGSVSLQNSVIYSDVTCDYINAKYSKAAVENCVFWGNKSPDTDAIDYDGVINGVIKNNKFYNFQGINSDAIDMGEESKNIQITGNLIYNSSDKGISVGQKSTVVVSRNLIVNCNMGVAIKDHSYAYIVQNSFYGNDYGVNCYEKNYGNGGGNADINSSIFSMSGVAAYAFDGFSTANAAYSISDTDVLPGTGNIYGSPLFVDTNNLNFELQSNSPCIDNGDPNLTTDPDGSNADIGAYYSYDPEDFPFDTAIELVINEINYNSSSSFDAKDWIELYNPAEIAINISGWMIKDDNDDHIFVIPEGTIINSGDFLVICNDSDAFTTLFPLVSNFVGNMDYGFSKNGDWVRLFDQNEKLIDFVAYENQSPWPTRPDGGGYSLELTDNKLDNNLSESWKSSESIGGSPGRINTVFTNLDDENDTDLPVAFDISQNYPNPFNPTTVINYSVPMTSKVTIDIYNLLGQKKLTLVDEIQSPGKYSVNWNASSFSSGVYFYKITASDYVNIKKCLLMK